MQGFTYQKKKKNIVKIYGTMLNSALLWLVWKLDLQTEVTCNNHSIVDTKYSLLMFLSPGMVFIFFPGFLLWSLFVHRMQPVIVLSLIFCYNFNLILVITLGNYVSMNEKIRSTIPVLCYFWKDTSCFEALYVIET